MVVISMTGGLGNQMFQYCLFKTYQKKGVNIKLDVSGYGINSIRPFSDERYNQTGYMLEDLFNVKCVYASKFDRCFAKNMPSVFLGAKRGEMRAFNTVSTTNYKELMFSNEEILSKKYQQLKHGLLFGYWQYPEHYFDVLDQIKKDFCFKNPLDEKNKQTAQKIAATNSVSIHVRRGDYLSYTDHFYSLGKKYYNEALDIIREKNKDIEIFVFSDDVTWCKENLGLKDAHYVDGNYGDKNYIDMQLMSLCKHNIIANSTFSLWAALLNDNKQKIVVSPKHYVKKDYDLLSKTMPKEFVLIDNSDSSYS